MVKSQDLRIGNLVNDRGSIPYAVDAIDLVALRQSEIAGKINIDFKPIPLTEEWLVKFGFEKKESAYWDGAIQYDIDTIPFSIIFINDNYHLQYAVLGGPDGFDYLDNPIKYVHQLQNLYYFLKDEELTLKQPVS